MTKKVEAFLNENNLTEQKFEQILNEVTSHQMNLKMMIIENPLGWTHCNVKVLERILDIYDNSQVDLITGEIIKINFE